MIELFVFISLILSPIASTEDIVLNRKQNSRSDTVEAVLSKDNVQENMTSKLREDLANSHQIWGINTKSNHSKRDAEPEDRAVLRRVQPLCDNLYIHGADRLPNNTVRIYRDEYYWDLIGIPDRRVNVRGPFRIWLQFMPIFDKYCSIQTVTSGYLNGHTFMYRFDRFWSWYSDGRVYSGRGGGDQSDLIPKSITGFWAVYNDGDLDKKGFSQMIAFC